MIFQPTLYFGFFTFTQIRFTFFVMGPIYFLKSSCTPNYEVRRNPIPMLVFINWSRYIN